MIEGVLRSSLPKAKYFMRHNIIPRGSVPLQALYEVAISGRSPVFTGPAEDFPQWLQTTYSGMFASKAFRLEFPKSAESGGVETLEGVIMVEPPSTTTRSKAGFPINRENGFLTEEAAPISQLSPALAAMISPQEIASLRIKDNPKKVLASIKDVNKLKMAEGIMKTRAGKGILRKLVIERIRELH